MNKKTKKPVIYAFIDSQNLNLAIRDMGWKIDFARFRIYLNEKYGSKYVIYDTWIPTDYYAFVSNDETWEDVKERTQVREVEMKAALYLYLLTTISGRKFANKLKTKNVLKILESWGITEDVVSIFNLKKAILMIFKL